MSPTPVLWLFAIQLSATDGTEISRQIKAGPFQDIGACSTEQVKTGTQHPVDGKITVYQCGTVNGEKAS